MVPCPLCNLELRDQYNLQVHHKSNHQCNYCTKQFSLKDNLKIHKKSCSGNDKFTHKGHLNDHEKICGLKKLEKHKYECLICFPNLTFASNRNLVNHLKTHEKEKSYKCTECTKSFSTSLSLSQHNNLHIKAF